MVRRLTVNGYFLAISNGGGIVPFSVKRRCEGRICAIMSDTRKALGYLRSNGVRWAVFERSGSRAIKEKGHSWRESTSPPTRRARCAICTIWATSCCLWPPTAFRPSTTFWRTRFLTRARCSPSSPSSGSSCSMASWKTTSSPPMWPTCPTSFSPMPTIYAGASCW